MATTSIMPVLVQQKLDAFADLQPEFETCFRFLQDVHGLKRFSAFSIADCVRYLHARWICELKSQLLSVPRAREYDGRRSLEVLRLWQEQQDTASVVSFLYEKLDMFPVASVTQRIQELQNANGNPSAIARLKHGRTVMLNRGTCLLHALETIFALPEEELALAVKGACTQYGHQPDQIQQQIALMDMPLYHYLPHQALAQRNMLVTNQLGTSVTVQPAEPPDRRSSKADMLKAVTPPYAEEVINDYQDMTSVMFNNLLGKRFLDRPVQHVQGVKGS
jgi:hypothetical protein